MGLEKDGLLERWLGVCFCKTARYDVSVTNIEALLAQ